MDIKEKEAFIREKAVQNASGNRGIGDTLQSGINWLYRDRINADYRYDASITERMAKESF